MVSDYDWFSMRTVRISSFFHLFSTNLLFLFLPIHLPHPSSLHSTVHQIPNHEFFNYSIIDSCNVFRTGGFLLWNQKNSTRLTSLSQSRNDPVNTMSPQFAVYLAELAQSFPEPFICSSSPTSHIFPSCFSY